MKYLKRYNESLRDKMVPKSEKEILDVAYELGLENTMVRLIDQDEWNNETENSLVNIKLLLDNGADPSHMNYIILRYACQKGDFDFVKELFDKYKVPITAGEDIALKTSAEYQKIKILNYVIENGANIKEHGDEAMEHCLDQALNHSWPIINDAVIVLVNNGVSKEKVKKYLYNYFGDSTINEIMMELDRKLSGKNIYE